MKFYCEEASAVLAQLKSNPAGLTGPEAARRLEQNGKNCLQAPKGKSFLQRLLSAMADPMILILLGAAVISGILAVIEDSSPADVIIILAVVAINAVLSVLQESKAEKAIDALMKMTPPLSKVLRDGRQVTLPSEALVVGDVLVLEAGDAVPADARILECASLKAEESALTGESVPVVKQAAALEPEAQGDTPLGDRKNMLYSGGTVVYGRGVAVVTAAGMDTEMGKIAASLAQAREGDTPLQKKLNKLSKLLTWLVLGICAAVFAVQVLRAGSLHFEPIVNSLMAAVSLAVAAIPEGLAAVVTVVLSIGVTNMSKRNAIIRKLTAVETLGCAGVICSDKTGTLTQNKMTVVESFGAAEKELSAAMALCSDAEVDDNGAVTGEPTEAALVAWAEKVGKSKRLLKQDFPRVGEAPFDSMRKMMSTLHRTPAGKVVQYTKGAPDVVLARCSTLLKNGVPVPMTASDRAELLKANKAMADKALRVLACGLRLYPALPEDLSPETLETDLCFMGLCGMIDPVRPEVLPAISRCRSAGIRPIMITGDHIDTATAIARELGILTPGTKAVTGSMLDAMSDAEFEKEFKSISVYGRVRPEHKTRIVAAWQKAGFVTAMTGDGVNDAPSIKTADIGVGMGITGTDVTKNAADMILADDNFATIVVAVEEGRRIYDNICKSIQFLLGSNMSEVIAVFVSTLLGFTVLKPVHLLWINLITDTFPALALGTEPADADVMNRPPRSADEGIFANGMGFDIAYQSILAALLVLGAYFIGLHIETGSWAPADSALGTAMAFLTMASAEIFHSINLRSRRQSLLKLKTKNRLMVLSALTGLVTMSVVCLVPPIAKVFSLPAVTFGQYIGALALGALMLPAVELVKALQRKKR